MGNSNSDLKHAESQAQVVCLSNMPTIQEEDEDTNRLSITHNDQTDLAQKIKSTIDASTISHNASKYSLNEKGISHSAKGSRLSITVAEDNVCHLHSQPPDGGWGWVIVGASFMCNFFVDGIIFSFGVFIQSLQNEFNVNKSSVSWIGSSLAGCYLFVGPFVSALTNRFGFRIVAICGAIIASVSFFLSSIASSLTYIILCYGLIGGLGFGMIYLPAVIAVGFFFDKRRALATGISVCGSGIGTILVAPLNEHLLSVYGWRKTFRVQAVLVLCCIFFSLLFRPMSKKNVNEKFSTCTSHQGTPLMLRIKRARDKFLEDDVSNGSIYSIEASNYRCSNLQTHDRVSETDSITMKKIPKSNQRYFSLRKRSSLPQMNLKHYTRNYSDQGYDNNSYNSVTNVSSETFINSNAAKNPKIISNLNFPNNSAKQLQVPVERNCSTTKDVKDLSHFCNTFSAAVSNDPERRVSNSEVDENSVQTLCAGASECLANNTESVDNECCDDNLCDEVSENIRWSFNVDDIHKPMYREDVFYTGSIQRLSKYRSQKSLDEYHASVTHLPVVNDCQLTTKWCCGFTTQTADSFQDVLSLLLDFSLMSNYTFLLFAITGFIGMFGLFLPFIYLVDWAETIGIGTTRATYLLSVIGASNTIGRILCGWLSDYPGVNALIVNNVALAAGGFACVLVPYFTKYEILVVYGIVFGLAVACFASLRSILVVQLLGLEKLNNAFGLTLLFHGVATLIGGPIVGCLFDVNKNYDVIFHISGVMFIFSAILGCPLNMIKQWEANRQNKNLCPV